MGTVWSGEMQDNTRQTAEFVSRSCGCAVVRKTGDGDRLRWPLSLATADSGLVTEQLQTAARSSQHLSLQTQELLTGHQWRTQALDILSSVLFDGFDSLIHYWEKKKSQLFLGRCHTCFCQQTRRSFLCSFLTFQEEAEPLWVIIVHAAGKTMGWSLGNRSPAWLCLQLEYVSETAPPPRAGLQLTK